MINNRDSKIQRPVSRYFVNYHIRATNVICIDHTEKNLGELPLIDAINLAKANSLDLVLVSPAKNGGSPICKILDFGKFKYEQDKKEKVAKKKQKENEIKIKEIKFRPNTAENDLAFKAKQMQEFLDEGNRVKITIMFKGREIVHKEIGISTLNKFVALLTDFQYESTPQIMGKQLTTTLLRKSAAKTS